MSTSQRRKPCLNHCGGTLTSTSRPAPAPDQLVLVARVTLSGSAGGLCKAHAAGRGTGLAGGTGRPAQGQGGPAPSHTQPGFHRTPHLITVVSLFLWVAAVGMVLTTKQKHHHSS